MRNYFAGLNTRYWNRMFHKAYEGRRSYRTAAQVEAVVIAVLVGQSHITGRMVTI